MGFRMLAVLAVATLCGCVDRGRELSREALAKRYVEARRYPTTVIVNRIPVTTWRHESERWEILYLVRWELTEPTHEWRRVSRDYWHASEAPAGEGR